MLLAEDRVASAFVFSGGVLMEDSKNCTTDPQEQNFLFLVDAEDHRLGTRVASNV